MHFIPYRGLIIIIIEAINTRGCAYFISIMISLFWALLHGKFVSSGPCPHNINIQERLS